jgi:outer membrane protein
LCLGVSAASAATILGVGAEADYYSPEASGTFRYSGDGTTSYTAFNKDVESSYQLGIYFEHPVPMLPNLRVDLTPSFEFYGSDGVGGTNRVTLKQTDITPYYEILDNVVDLDIGVSFKVVDGKVEGVIDQSFTEVIPMGYLGASLMIPGLPISFAGSIKYIGYDGDSFSDSRIKAMWDIVPGVKAQAGYREESLKVGGRYGIDADATFKGPYFGVSFQF